MITDNVRAALVIASKLLLGLGKGTEYSVKANFEFDQFIADRHPKIIAFVNELVVSDNSR